MLLLDEPTNHLDIETIDALADAIKAWNGGLVLVSHDFRLINQVAEEIWECNRGTITKWEGDIVSYKENLISSIDSEDYGIAQSADNRERKEPVQKPKAAPAKVFIICCVICFVIVAFSLLLKSNLILPHSKQLPQRMEQVKVMVMPQQSQVEDMFHHI